MDERVMPQGDALDHRRLMERIEEPFDASRAHPWPRVVDFLESLEPEGWVLDLAAGNGRHALEAGRLGHRVLAVDVARGLMRRLRERARAQGWGVECVEADVHDLPLVGGLVTHALYAAGLHCIRGRADRVASVRELCRVLRPGGSVMVTVWWRDPERFKSPLRRTRERLQAGPPEVPGGDAPPVEEGDVVLPWRHGLKRPVDRFFHLYREDELRADLVAGGLDPDPVRRERFGSTWNLVVRARRPVRG